MEIVLPSSTTPIDSSTAFKTAAAAMTDTKTNDIKIHYRMAHSFAYPLIGKRHANTKGTIPPTTCCAIALTVRRSPGT